MISVIVPHLNQPAALEACLCSLDVQSLSRDLFEIIVVDNGSATPPVDVIAAHRSVRLLHESQPGPGPARNAGAANARGDIFAFMDADCRAHPDWLTAIDETFQQAGPGTILGGEVRIWPLAKGRLTAIEAYESVFGFRNRLYVTKHGYSVTANLAVRRADFAAIGPFPGIQFAEDMQWGQLAIRAGRQFRYVPEMIVLHPARRSLQELYAKWDRQITHYRNMAQGRRGWQIRWFALALLIFGSPAVSAISVLTTSRVRGISDRVKAIAVLCAVRSHRTAKMLALLRGQSAVIWNR
ncbi:glycosyl transferase [Bradyrhizobium sp. LTSP849]|jgi:glycosyltransferase involved in cell wall biosynthesis|uniref:glycosyltransferase n=1 Tax=unclassified Bradyrhizobium TaxID=2631580 RepID=UPI0005D139DE|nr:MULTISPECIES: glycosyltransferase [unclassified Bradyrhizobium]KJC40963.1 glycosyl transferase [Bradyrhizobium sp. LTSP849]KJC50107.1 glycosyl transferase [Bradyrhizobium sp. LTSP857]